MSLLKEIVKKEALARATVAAQLAAEKDEAAKIVGGIHTAIDPELPYLMALALRGDYQNAVPIKGQRITTASGLTLELGSSYPPATLKLWVSPRKGEQLATVELSKDVSGRVRGDVDIASFPGHTPPEEMVRAFLQALAPYLIVEGA